MKKSARILTGMAAAIVLAGAIAGWSRAKENQSAVRAVLPAQPATQPSWPVELRKRIETANTDARGLFSSARGLAELSRLYHANGLLAEAASCYRGLEWLDAGEPRWRHRHAMILAGFGEMDAAIALERQVVDRAPDYVPARLRLGDLLLKHNQTAEAVRTYQDVLERQPSEPYAQLGLARVDFDAGEWEKARRRLEPLVEQTDFRLGYDLIVTTYEKLGRKEEASRIRGFGKTSGAFRDPADPWMEELSAWCFDTYRLGLLSVNAERGGDLSGAIQLAERALEIEPEDVTALFQLANLCRQKSEFSRARTYLQQCTKIAPTFADGWAHLSSLLTQLNDPAGAGKALEEGLRACPESPGLYLMQARNLMQAGRPEEAIRAYRQSTRFRFNEADAFVELALVLFRLGRVEEGISEVEKSLVAEPENPRALGLMTYHALLLRDEAAASRWLMRIQNQPRVSKKEAERLKRAYAENFGRPWSAPR